MTRPTKAAALSVLLALTPALAGCQFVDVRRVPVTITGTLDVVNKGCIYVQERSTAKSKRYLLGGLPDLSFPLGAIELPDGTAIANGAPVEVAGNRVEGGLLGGTDGCGPHDAAIEVTTIRPGTR